MEPTAPDLTVLRLAYTPTCHFVAGDFEPEALIAALKEQPALEDFEDDAGMQGRVRLELDADPETNPGYWVIVPEDVDQATIDAGVAAYTPPTPPQATSSDVQTASSGIINANLAEKGLGPDDVPPILEALLSQTKAAIPFFEQHALDPSMTSSQWAAFQALDQTTKDRLLYDLIRSMAALMRYLSGDLPTG